MVNGRCVYQIPHKLLLPIRSFPMYICDFRFNQYSTNVLKSEKRHDDSKDIKSQVQPPDPASLKKVKDIKHEKRYSEYIVVFCKYASSPY